MANSLEVERTICYNSNDLTSILMHSIECDSDHQDSNESAKRDILASLDFQPLPSENFAEVQALAHKQDRERAAKQGSSASQAEYDDFAENPEFYQKYGQAPSLPELARQKLDLAVDYTRSMIAAKLKNHESEQES